MQASFLAYGLHVLWSSRPVFLVGSDVRFTLITAGEIDPTDLAQASRPEWRKLPWRGPHLFAVALPQNPQLKAQLVQIYFDTGRDLDQLPAHYRPFDEVAAAVRRNAESLNGRDGTPNAPGGGVGLPILAGNGNASMTVDPSTGWPVMVVMP